LGKKSESLRFHPKVLTPLQKKVLGQVGAILAEWQFYLGGGTALAIYFGHRHSVDLDWFTGVGIADPLRLAQDFRDKGVPFITGEIERGTLHGTLSGIRVSFLEYRYPLLKKPVFWPQFSSRIASLEDLACMKLSAIAQRGSKKDFVDMYALGMKRFPLEKMIRLYQQKYDVKDIAHLLYGLAYFDEAEKERMPKIYWNIDWQKIKKTIQGWVREMVS
jgi:hypothetical protein